MLKITIVLYETSVSRLGEANNGNLVPRFYGVVWLFKNYGEVEPFKFG